MEKRDLNKICAVIKLQILDGDEGYKRGTKTNES